MPHVFPLSASGRGTRRGPTGCKIAKLRNTESRTGEISFCSSLATPSLNATARRNEQVPFQQSSRNAKKYSINASMAVSVVTANNQSGDRSSLFALWSPTLIAFQVLRISSSISGFPISSLPIAESTRTASLHPSRGKRTRATRTQCCSRSSSGRDRFPQRIEHRKMQSVAGRQVVPGRTREGRRERGWKRNRLVVISSDEILKATSSGLN